MAYESTSHELSGDDMLSLAIDILDGVIPITPNTPPEVVGLVDSLKTNVIALETKLERLPQAPEAPGQQPPAGNDH